MLALDSKHARIRLMSIDLLTVLADSYEIFLQHLDGCQRMPSSEERSGCDAPAVLKDDHGTTRVPLKKTSDIVNLPIDNKPARCHGGMLRHFGPTESRQPALLGSGDHGQVEARFGFSYLIQATEFLLVTPIPEIAQTRDRCPHDDQAEKGSHLRRTPEGALGAPAPPLGHLAQRLRVDHFYLLGPRPASSPRGLCGCVRSLRS
mmetsp:Transcript_21970/g.42753  ORF Transcript_21970/g.42753 Transcript_21970/m.42753 type:complete len:204 (+) Transcript_21970:1126-1737(+)